MNNEERWAKIRADFEQGEQYGHGCDGCGCSCCSALEWILNGGEQRGPAPADQAASGLATGSAASPEQSEAP